jgi:peptide deformylase
MRATVLLLLGALAFSGCVGSRSMMHAAGGGVRQVWSLTAEEQRLVDQPRDDFALVVRGGPGGAVLRQRARSIPADVDLRRIAARMERTMRAASGVGVAAPQVGLSLRAVTLLLDYRTDRPRVVFARNPVIVARADETILSYEGCLSVPNVGGLVRRARWVAVRYIDVRGRLVRQRAEGPNAVLWQHELDHLDGVLYVDRLIGELLPAEEMRRRRALEQEAASRPAR